MNMSRDARLVRTLKGLPDARGARLPVRGRDMTTIGFMSVFDNFRLADDELVKTMAAARSRFGEFFLTQFGVTYENKKNWLENSVLRNDRKILFIVETGDGKIVGQDGVTLPDGDNFMLDGTMRWAMGGYPRLFERTCIERACIGFGLFGRLRCVINVFNDNKFAILNIESSGFVVREEHALSRTEQDGRVIFAAAETPELVNTDKKLVEYEMYRDRFAERHGAFIDSPCWEGIV
ncbi:MAG: hypothetical protein LBE65_05745 [Synergistaceae bacterium]|jgi:hypothetical protein|nr:hypothetical protein [Synergistaceae bacterium]